MNKRKQAGFSLIELMGVLLIIAILASFAVGAVRDQIASSQVTSAIALTSSLRNRISTFYSAQGTMPLTRAELNLGPATDTAGTYVTQAAVDDGAIVITYGNEASNLIDTASLVMLPVADADGNLSFICSPAPAPAGLTLQTATVVASTVDPAYVPSSCQ
jgi:type IV pilus assembly protein PilA